MTSTTTTSPDDSASRNITPPMNIDMSGIYDLRHPGQGGDDRSASTSSSCMYGTTILSSLAPSSLTQSFQFQDDETRAKSDTAHASTTPSLSLSLNPSMVDSSVVIPSNSNLQRASLSQSSISSSGDMSSCDASHSSQCYAPELFANIGRSLMLASASKNSSDDDGCDSPPELSGVTASAAKGVKWWDQLQTDDDWDKFRASAHDCLNSLVVEEKKDMRHGKFSRESGSSMEKTLVTKEVTQQNRVGLFRVRQWLQGLFEALTSSAVGFVSEEKSAKTNYISSLVKQIVEIQQQLEKLPPAPPTLPEGLPLDDLPSESRYLLVQYRDRLDAWRREAMPQHEELSTKHVQCQEKLLAAIIDAEEAQFWGTKKDSMENEEKVVGYEKEDECQTLGTVNDDGYVDVIEKESPLWDEVSETRVDLQSKCQLTLSAALVAALTAGAGFFLTLQSKRSR